MADTRFEQRPLAANSAQRGEYTEVQDRLLLSTMECDGAPILALDD